MNSADSELDQLQSAPAEDIPVLCAPLIGCAGTGKTTTLMNRKNADPSYGMLTSTTGISAINLGGGTMTLNSTLGFFDTASLHDAFMKGSITRKLHQIAQRYRNLI